MTYQPLALNALGDPTRRAIFERLADRPSAVGELAGDFPVSRPAVSQHLKILKAAQLVTVHARGTQRVYAVDKDGIASLRKWLDQFWDETLLAFKNAAELQAAKEASRQPSEKFTRKTKGRIRRQLK